LVVSWFRASLTRLIVSPASHLRADFEGHP
jgi:hypothetical protein